MSARQTKFRLVNVSRRMPGGSEITEIEVRERLGDGEFVLLRSVGHAVPVIRRRMRQVVAALNAGEKGGAR